MTCPAPRLLAALGVLGIVLLVSGAGAQTQQQSPLPGGTPPVSGTPPLPAKPELPPGPGAPSAPPAAPGVAPGAAPGQIQPFTLTAPTGPDAPPPGTGAIPGQSGTTLQQLPREYLTPPSGIRAFPTPEETKGKVLTMEDAVKISLEGFGSADVGKAGAPYQMAELVTAAKAVLKAALGIA